MFRASSWIRRAGVCLLLASLGAGIIALPHAGDGDAACLAPVAAHDESAHYIGASPTQVPRDTDHCFLCHSVRSFYPAFDKFEPHQHGPRNERLHISPIDRALLVAWSLVPGRAPPV